MEIFVGFEVLIAVVMKSSIFWDITLCKPLKVNRRFRGLLKDYTALHPLRRTSLEMKSSISIERKTEAYNMLILLFII
jgi:hypothetical protein